MPSLKSYIKKAATNAVKKRAAKGAAGAMAGVFGTGLVGKALSAQMDDVVDYSGDSDAGEQQGTSQKSIALQKNMAGTLVRIETIAQHISDNLYNIAGVMNAQLTSMEETRRDMATQSSREAATKEEKMTQGILRGQVGEGAEGGSGSLAKKLLVGQAIKAAVTNPYVLGTLALLASAVGLKLAWNRRDPEQAPSINEQAKENGLTPGAQGALNAQNALKRDMDQRFGAQEQAVLAGGGRGVVNPEMAASLPERLPSTGAGAGRGIGGAAPVVEAGAGRGVINPQDAIAIAPASPMVTPSSPAPTFFQGGRNRGSFDSMTFSPAPTLASSSPASPSTGPAATLTPQQTSAVVPSMAEATSKPAATPSIPNSGGGIPNLDYASYSSEVAKRESGGAGGYKAENSLGFLGKYQMGAAALEDAGLLKKGTYADKSTSNKQKVDNPSNWTLPGGKEAFLNNGELQEKVMKSYTARNFKSLLNMGIITAKSLKNQVAGYLAAAHLVGPGGARALAQGTVKADAYGSKSTEYFALGARSQGPTASSTISSAGTIVASAPSSGSTISTQSVQVASAAKAGGGTTNINTVNNNGGGQQMASARREIPSPIAGRGSLEQSTVFAASA